MLRKIVEITNIVISPFSVVDIANVHQVSQHRPLMRRKHACRWGGDIPSNDNIRIKVEREGPGIGRREGDCPAVRQGEQEEHFNSMEKL